MPYTYKSKSYTVILLNLGSVFKIEIIVIQKYVLLFSRLLFQKNKFVNIYLQNLSIFPSLVFNPYNKIITLYLN